MEEGINPSSVGAYLNFILSEKPTEQLSDDEKNLIESLKNLSTILVDRSEKNES